MGVAFLGREVGVMLFRMDSDRGLGGESIFGGEGRVLFEKQRLELERRRCLRGCVWLGVGFVRMGRNWIRRILGLDGGCP